MEVEKKQAHTQGLLYASISRLTMHTQPSPPKQMREWMGPMGPERSVLALETCLLPAPLVCEALQKPNLGSQV